ncbi:bacillithiol biosynthesis cysteine-adding enzyme BshC [Mesonia maritima]|uniref:Putative cysteine ligase BshC n=1 Tax=Mesonia maritima TaxID=1793873 RepID=A0ABU1K876_9FLAO|nr:bacillithiol biosynthesis cysteine-adding enzyme BshC [Mesonia maritima]MDR6301465.1 bacillithiol biosynthesis cysteine-adding enzyme BshC [Mesonia maritima]
MADCISYRDTNYFSNLITDYLAEEKKLDPFYGNFPKIENFEKQIEEKKKSYSVENRKILVETLQKQYANFSISTATQENLQLLAQENTFTVTTGHQLNLFTGPLYFLYKIISTINLCEKLKEKYPTCNFVPIYWMATEDHDFEEINFFNFKENKIQWNRKANGAVGELNTNGLEKVFEEFSTNLNASKNAEELKKLFKEAYVEHENLSAATHYLANELFGEDGLVILDANQRSLKKLFIPFVKDELLKQTSHTYVQETTTQLSEKNYKIQVNPREINLFYLKENLRERIIEEENQYFIHETELRFSEKEMLEEVENHPERFSPNVIMRPLYQEVILPNLSYIGGGGELAYWFQLKEYFKAEKVPFPILLLRNSALLISEKQQKKLNRLGVSLQDLFLNQADLKTKHTQKISEIDIDFSKQKKHLENQFSELYNLAEKTDKSFIGAVAAQEKKQINGLSHLEKRLLKAQKRKLKDELDRLTTLQNELFPKQNLQERQANFSEFYEAYGNGLIQLLKEELDPLKQKFSIIELK